MPYAYLRLAENEIRLLDLRPGTGNEHIQGTLLNIRFSEDDSPQYETISYCWGDSQRHDSITLDGVRVEVPKSSVEALKCMRHPDKHRVLWIDSLCINQTDIIERNSQVSKMARIYAKSQTNLIYLGDDDGTSDAAKKAILDLREEVRLETNDFTEFRESMRQLQGLSKQKKTHEWTWRTHTDIAERAILRLFERPWFYRLWVVQEAVMAPESVCYCGRQICFGFAELSRIAIWLAYNQQSTSRRLNGCDGLHNTANMWALIRDPMVGPGSKKAEEKDHSLSNLMDIASYRACSEQKDQIFAIIGMALEYCHDDEHVDNSLLTVDYAKDWMTILADAARFAILQIRELGILGSVRHRTDGPLSLKGAPSWVPRIDFSSWDEDSGILFRNLFHAAAKALLDISRAQRDYLGPGVLSLRGFPVARIAHVTCVTSNDVLESDSHFQTLIRSIVDICSTSREHDFHHWFNNDLVCSVIPRALAVTLLAGRGSNHLEAATNADVEAMQAYLIDIVENRRDSSFRHMTLVQRDILAYSCRNRRFFRTDSGTIGLGPRCTQIGDEVLVLAGAELPFIARKLDTPFNDFGFHLLGESYVHGIMNGEAVHAARADGKEECIFDFY